MVQIAAVVAVGLMEGVAQVNWRKVGIIAFWWFLAPAPLIAISAFLYWQGTTRCLYWQGTTRCDTHKHPVHSVWPFGLLQTNALVPLADCCMQCKRGTVTHLGPATKPHCCTTS